MAKTIQPPKHMNVQIASIDRKKFQWDTVDPMRAGEGTPWEDRGTLGPIKAYFLTAVAAMRRPGQLFAQIRRPHGRKDPIWYAVLAALPWGASWVMHSWLILWRVAAHHPDATINYYPDCTYASIFQFLAAPLIAWPLLLIAVAVLHRLVVGETHAKFPSSLTTNVVAYSMGPGIVSLVPLIGPPVAAVWTLVAMIIGCRVRLRLGIFGAAVCSILSVLAAAVVGTLIYLLVWGFMYGTSYSAYDLPPPPPVHIPRGIDR